MFARFVLSAVDFSAPAASIRFKQIAVNLQFGTLDRLILCVALP